MSAGPGHNLLQNLGFEDSTKRKLRSLSHPHHGIDAAATAKYMTKGHVEFTVVQLRQRGDGQVVIKRAANIVKPDARVHDSRRIVGSSRLDDEHLRAGGGQFRGKH